jgi:hypothetical protein
MAIAERRDTDEMVGHIMQQEAQRKLWFMLTLVGFIATTAILFATATPGGADLGLCALVNGGLTVVSVLFYRSRVRGKDRIGLVMPTMLALVSTVLVWVISRR